MNRETAMSVKYNKKKYSGEYATCTTGRVEHSRYTVNFREYEVRRDMKKLQIKQISTKMGRMIMAPLLAVK